MGLTVRTTKLISISIAPDLLEKADNLAQEEDRTRSAIFRDALRWYIKQKQQPELTAEPPQKGLRKAN